MSNIPSNDNRKQPISEEEYRRRQIRRRREIARKKQQRRNLFFAGCAAVVLVLIVGIILLCKSCSSDKPAAASGSISDSRIIGSYMLSDNSCTYTFKEDGSGYLQLTGGSQYGRDLLSRNIWTASWDRRSSSHQRITPGRVF